MDAHTLGMTDKVIGLKMSLSERQTFLSIPSKAKSLSLSLLTSRYQREWITMCEKQSVQKPDTADPISTLFGRKCHFYEDFFLSPQLS